MRRRVRVAIVGLLTAGLVARVIALGGRPFHWSEARVGYWALRFTETGVYEYRPVAGGPLVYLLARWTFELLPPTDAAARLPIALASGLAPGLALLFRDVLDDGETVALAGVLAFDPMILYYSRFLRGDVLAALCGLATIGALVRYRATDHGGWLAVAAGMYALAVGASGFAVAYPIVWLAAGLLVVDENRIRGTPDLARRTLAVVWKRLSGSVAPVARAVGVFLFVGFLLFAPRSGGIGPGIWRPTTWPAAVAGAVGAAERFVGVRVVYRLEPTTPGRHALVPYLQGILTPAVAASLATLVAAVAGVAAVRYGERRRRVVAFCGYVVAVGAFVFAVAAATPDPWVAVHLLVFATVPAAVGIARGWRTLRRRVTPTNPARVALAVALVAASVAVAVGPVAGVYAAPERSSPFAQYAQPADDPEELLPAAAGAMDRATGPDVVYVGPRFDTSREYGQPPVAAVDRRAWGARFPLPWYFERLDAGVTSVGSADGVPADPAVVVTTPGQADQVESALGGDYSRTRMQLALYKRPVVVFVHQ